MLYTFESPLIKLRKLADASTGPLRYLHDALGTYREILRNSISYQGKLNNLRISIETSHHQ